MKHPSLGHTLLLLLLLTPLQSCSVREDRTGCPCILTVDISGLLDEDITHPSCWNDGLVLSVFAGPVSLVSEKHTYAGAVPEYEYKVERDTVQVFGIFGLEQSRVEGRTVRVSEGVGADPLYVSSENVDCSGEEARTVLKMNKQFSKITIYGLDAFEMDMEAAASCSALDLYTRKALPGVFRCPLECDSEGVCSFLLPRQDRGEVSILFYDSSRALVSAIDLGKYLDEAGYDWDADSLADVTVRVDRVNVSISITIEGWTNSFEFSISI